ncbi:MAG TPA: TDT family transporter [Acidimicrobiales bacterium]|nr:TDT family transporter [Acidimicrobiales bacterium]
MTMTAPLAAPEEQAPRLAGAPTTRGSHALARLGLLRDLGHPRQVFGYVTPNWFAAVMGTGVLAVAGASLPEQFRGLRPAATAAWAVAAIMLVGVTMLTALHWRHHRSIARGHASDPVTAHFYGALPMALLTVGAGALLVGRAVLGLRVALDLDWTLWVAGTLAGLGTTVAVPYLMFTRHEVREDSAFGGWLMPVVPPMVSASTGALLVPYVPAGQARLTLLLGCYAMFGLSLVASVIIITLIWHRLVVHKTGPARMVPTLWIVLGPLGQSVTAANLLGGAAHLALPAPYSTVLLALGVAYGVPVLGFAALWGCLALAITVRTAREHLLFSLSWWSFTFPVGTCVTGTTGLALHTGSAALRVAAGLLFLALVGAWVVVAARTTLGSLRGGLFLPPELSGLQGSTALPGRAGMKNVCSLS